MGFIAAAAGLACLLLAIQLWRYRLELRNIRRQLELVRNGSHIEVGTGVRNKEFLALCRELNEVVDGIHEKEISCRSSQLRLKQTISSIAHDIRTPLTSAAGYLQMLCECTDEAKGQRYREIIGKRQGELKDMLEELFLYTKLSSDDYMIDCEPVSVYPVFCECILGMYYEFEEQSVEPVIRFEDEKVRLIASKESLSRIIHNLLHNALLHGSGNIEIEQKGTELIFSNMAAHPENIDTERLFERFYKADSSRAKGSSGLGLAIVKELTEKVGGRAEASVRDGRLIITLKLRPAN